MQKRHFEAIAQVLRDLTAKDSNGNDTIVDVALLRSRFADLCEAQNPRFDRSRFIAACAGKDSTDSAGRKVRYSA